MMSILWFPAALECVLLPCHAPDVGVQLLTDLIYHLSSGPTSSLVPQALASVLDSSSSILLSQDCFGYSGSFVFPYEL